MIQNYKKYFILLQVVLQTSIIASFFFKTFNYHTESESIPITGFEALVKNEYFIIGNVLIWVLLLGSIYHLFVLVVENLGQIKNQKIDNALTIVVNLQLFFSLFIVTFLGRHLEVLGLIVIALLVLSAYLNKQIKT